MATLRETLGLNNLDGKIGSGTLGDIASGDLAIGDVQNTRGRALKEGPAGPGGQGTDAMYFKPWDKAWRESNPDDWWRGSQYHQKKTMDYQTAINDGLTEEQAQNKAQVMAGSRWESTVAGAEKGADIGSQTGTGPYGTAIGGVLGAVAGATKGDMQAENVYDEHIGEVNADAEMTLAKESEQRAHAESARSQNIGAKAGGAYGEISGEQQLLDGMDGRAAGNTTFDAWRDARYGW